MNKDVPIGTDEVANWRSYIGRSEIRTQYLDPEPLRRFAAAVGSTLEVERQMPPLGHWAYFLETVPTYALGEDGHPQRGLGLLPSVALPRRMFAATSIRFIAPLLLGQEAQMTLTVADVKHKIGSSGDLIFVDVERVVSQAGTDRIRELQTIVYRGATQRIEAVEPKTASDVPQCLWTPTPTELFRFSAVTFNAHRIHYDLHYAQTEEGYPGLVVHGPLIAAKLYGIAISQLQGTVHRFDFRGQAPLFASQEVRFYTHERGSLIDAVRCDGIVAASARVHA